MRVKAYACYNKHDEIRRNSSSGAIFSALASYVISQNGVIYGVTMKEDCYSAVYIAVTNEADLNKLRGSKYLQAKMGDTYKRVKIDLEEGKIVLFTGTGCQVNGLKKFLIASKVKCDNLICVDVICHGVPSPDLWKKYVIYQEEKNKAKLKWIGFRCKSICDMDFRLKQSLTGISKEEMEEIYISKDKDLFMQMFLRNYCLRPSCYDCVAKKIKLSDITIADFWGIQDIVPEMYDGKGTSLVLIRTEKGADIFGGIKNELEVKEVSYEDGVKGNPVEYCSVARPPQRDSFFYDMETMSFYDLSKKYVVPIKVSIKSKIKRYIKQVAMPIFKIIGKEKKSDDFYLHFIFQNKN